MSPTHQDESDVRLLLHQFTLLLLLPYLGVQSDYSNTVTYSAALSLVTGETEKKGGSCAVQNYSTYRFDPAYITVLGGLLH